MTSFERACEFGDLKIVDNLIQNEKSSCDIDKGFLISCDKGHFDLAKHLIENCGADIHCYDNLAINWALHENHFRIVVYLFENSFYKFNDSMILESLRICLEKGYDEIIEYIYARNFKNIDSIINLCEDDHIDIFEKFCHIEKDICILSDFYMIACKYCSLPIIKYLVEVKSVNVKCYNSDLWIFKSYWKTRKIRKSDRFTTMLACFGGHIDVVEYLVSGGCDLNPVLYFSLACDGGNIEMVKYLRSKSENELNMHNQYNIGFLFVCDSGNFEIFKYLFRLVNISTYKQGFLKLCKNGYFEMLKYFLINCPVFFGHNIYRRGFLECCLNDHLEMIKYFVNNGNGNGKKIWKFHKRDIHDGYKKSLSICIREFNTESNRVCRTNLDSIKYFIDELNCDIVYGAKAFSKKSNKIFIEFFEMYREYIHDKCYYSDDDIRTIGEIILEKSSTFANLQNIKFLLDRIEYDHYEIFDFILIILNKYSKIYKPILEYLFKFYEENFFAFDEFRFKQLLVFACTRNCEYILEYFKDSELMNSIVFSLDFKANFSFKTLCCQSSDCCTVKFIKNNKFGRTVSQKYHNECKICYDEKPLTIGLPCCNPNLLNDYYMCPECWEKKQLGNRCPFCRKPLRSIADTLIFHYNERLEEKNK